ncbi:MAG: hypothetical protein JWN14_3233, partial [Chthonomonadales bacterium]|nr:hypothetical protein [Chthonomonadales bacterium]
MSLSSRYYVVRPVDQIFRQAIERQESIIFLKGPRHTGKTSLLTHGLRQMREEGRQVVLTDFRELTFRPLETLDVLYRVLAQSFADQLGLDAPPDRAWSSYRGPNENFERYLRLEILARHTTGLVWVIDEVDRIFPYSFSTEVFAMFRSWHNARALEFTGSLERL